MVRKKTTIDSVLADAQSSTTCDDVLSIYDVTLLLFHLTYIAKFYCTPIHILLYHAHTHVLQMLLLWPREYT